MLFLYEELLSKLLFPKNNENENLNFHKTYYNT